MTIDDASREFLVYAEADRLHAPTTVAKYRDCFSSWILPRFGRLQVNQVTPSDLLAFRKAMVDRGLSVARQSTILAALRSFLKFCRSVLRVECLAPAEISLPRRPQCNPDALDNEQVQRVLAGPNIRTMSGLRLRAFVELLLATGLRLSEALSLDRQTVEGIPGEVDIIGKGGKKRTIFLNDRVHFWVSQYLARRADSSPALFVTTGDDPKRWSAPDVSYHFSRLKKQLGLPKLHPHLLRHTFCTNLLNNGADITFIKELAGHADIQTTARYYLRVDKAALRRVVGRHLNYETRLAA